jgi:hypothetical protein
MQREYRQGARPGRVTAFFVPPLEEDEKKTIPRVIGAQN